MLPRKLEQTSHTEQDITNSSKSGNRDKLKEFHKKEQRDIEAYELQNNREAYINGNKDNNSQKTINDFMYIYEKRKGQRKEIDHRVTERPHDDLPGSVEHHKESKDRRFMHEERGNIDTEYQQYYQQDLEEQQDSSSSQLENNVSLTAPGHSDILSLSAIQVGAVSVPEAQQKREVAERQARLEKINSLLPGTIEDAIHKIDNYKSKIHHSPTKIREYAAVKKVSESFSSFRDYKKYKAFYEKQGNTNQLRMLESDVEKGFESIKSNWSQLTDNMKNSCKKINISFDEN